MLMVGFNEIPSFSSPAVSTAKRILFRQRSRSFDVMAWQKRAELVPAKPTRLTRAANHAIDQLPSLANRIGSE